MSIEHQIERLIRETSEMPSSSKYVYLQLFYAGEGEKPFIAGAYGNVAFLDEIESSILEEWEEYIIFKVPGDYLFKCYYESPQYGEFGRIEIPEYWGFDLMKFKPIPEAV